MATGGIWRTLRDRRHFSQTLTPPTRLPPTPAIMISTELGLTFERQHKHWRCKEHPELLMYPDGQFGIAGYPARYNTAANALGARPRPGHDPST